jgi:hypothetical protein
LAESGAGEQTIGHRRPRLEADFEALQKCSDRGQAAGSGIHRPADAGKGLAPQVKQRVFCGGEKLEIIDSKWPTQIAPLRDIVGAYHRQAEIQIHRAPAA